MCKDRGMWKKDRGKEKEEKMEEKIFFFLQERGVEPPPLCLESVTLTTRP